MIAVQFKDHLKEEITGVFSSQQDKTEYHHQGLVSEDDPRYIAYKEVNPDHHPVEWVSSGNSSE